MVTLCSPVFPCVTLCSPLLPCVTVCYSVSLCFPVLLCVPLCYPVFSCVTLCYSVFPCVTLCYAVLLCVPLCYSVFPCVTLCYPVLPFKSKLKVHCGLNSRLASRFSIPALIENRESRTNYRESTRGSSLAGQKTVDSPMTDFWIILYGCDTTQYGYTVDFR